MGALLSKSDTSYDILSSIQKEGFKLKLPAFRIEPSDFDGSSNSSSAWSIIQQWFALMFITAVTYTLFVYRKTIVDYFTNFNPDEFADDFKAYRTGATDKLSSASSFVKTNIVDEIASGTGSLLKGAYSAAKDEASAIAKDTFMFVKDELVGAPQTTDDK